MERKGTVASKQATGTYALKNWDEKTWDGKDYKDQPGAKFTHAKVTEDFHGDIEGEGIVQFLMAYRDDTFASFVGLQQITGRIGDRSGSFVLQIIGVFENGAANSTWSVIPGSGIGDLRGLRGDGELVAGEGNEQPYKLNYYFE